ncbi:MAG: LON peptidase substrate-binding domain-containing protein [Pyrinomonadaceae bacterium]
MENHLNEVRIVQTDSASWFLFHPADLARRDKDPINWWAYDFAVRREFAAGTLVGVTTGGDGGFSVRLTDQGLTQRENKYAVKSQSFRLRVRHGRLLIDGGYVLPSEYGESAAEDSPDWIKVQNRDYRVTVHALAWYEEPGAVDHEGSATKNALTAYVAVFDVVQGLKAFDVPSSIPQLDPSRPEDTFFPNPESESVQESWEQDFAILVRPEVVFPGVPQELSLTREQYAYVNKALRSESRFAILIVNQPKSQSISTLFNISAYGASDGSPEQPGEFSMSGHGIHIVRLIRVREENGILWARVKPLRRSTSKVELASVAELQQRFAKFAANNSNYRKQIPHAQFHAERVAALTNPLEVGCAIASVLDLPTDTKQQLLSSTETELIERLNRALSYYR